MERICAGTLRTENIGQRVTLHGWVQKRRDFGELIFIDLRDRSGICQVVVDQNRVSASTGGSVVETAKELRSEFVVRIEGEVIARLEDRRNPKLPTGDVEILASGIEI